MPSGDCSRVDTTSSPAAIVRPDGGNGPARQAPTRCRTARTGAAAAQHLL